MGTRSLLWLGVLLAGSAAAAPSGLEGELGLRLALANRDRTALQALVTDRAAPAQLRGRALLGLYPAGSAPLAAEERSSLAAALTDPAAEVRLAALRVLGRRPDRTLEAEALKRAAEDPDPEVRVEALRVVRPWARQGHVFFLESALKAPWPKVRAEALVNLAAVPFGSLSADSVRLAEDASRPEAAPEVRLRAFQTLKTWNRLTWPRLRETLEAKANPEDLRLYALSTSERLADPAERTVVLLEIVRADPSQLLVRQAFRALRLHGSPELPSSAASYLSSSEKRNPITEELAAFLRGKGYRAEYEAGVWRVSAR